MRAVQNERPAIAHINVCTLTVGVKRASHKETEMKFRFRGAMGVLCQLFVLIVMVSVLAFGASPARAQLSGSILEYSTGDAFPGGGGPFEFMDSSGDPFNLYDIDGYYVELTGGTDGDEGGIIVSCEVTEITVPEYGIPHYISGSWVTNTYYELGTFNSSGDLGTASNLVYTLASGTGVDVIQSDCGWAYSAWTNAELTVNVDIADWPSVGPPTYVNVWSESVEVYHP
jgi:hypothetical protein